MEQIIGQIDNIGRIEKDIFDFNYEKYMNRLEQKPWLKDVKYFKKVQISITALMKMLAHCKMGGEIEVMGLMLGRIERDTFIIIDSFALPVEGTETRVYAQADANTYINEYIDTQELLKRREFGCGWYHSHPNYGCWLSGIDVATQRLNQLNDPWVAIVIDPIRTQNNHQVEIGAFRTFPQNHQHNEQSDFNVSSIPQDKISDFGVHHQQYYSLEVGYFRTEQDQIILQQLYQQFWINNISQSKMLMQSQHFHEQLLFLNRKFINTIKGINQTKYDDQSEFKQILHNLINRKTKSTCSSSKQHLNEYNNYAVSKNNLILDELFTQNLLD